MSVQDIKLSFLKDGIDQIAVIVEDLDKAVETYWNMLGIGPWTFYTYGKPLIKSASYRGQPADFTMRIALASLGSLGIELIEMVRAPTIYHDWVEAHGYGQHHVGILVEDMGAALAEAREAGLAVIQEGTGFGLDGDGHFAYLDTEDALGMLVELIEVPKRRVAPDKIYPPPQDQERLS